MVELGQIIVADNERYEVSQIWPAGASTVIDFIGKQLKKCGTDIEGNPVYAGRGFSYAVKNWVPEEVIKKECIGIELMHEKSMINLEKIKKLAIEIHGPLTFEVKESPSVGELFTKFYELHMFQNIVPTE